MLNKIKPKDLTPDLLVEWVGNDEPFECTSLRGSPVASDRTGEMMGPPRHAYLDDYYDHQVTYLITSYGTPIAWRTRKGWHIPDVGYSNTTSGHQVVVRMAFTGRARAPKKADAK